MRFPVAVMLIAVGYATLYYGLSKLIEFRPNESTTQLHSAVAPYMVLLGVKLSGDKGGTESVPFSLQTSGDSAQPISNGNAPSDINSGGVQNV